MREGHPRQAPKSARAPRACAARAGAAFGPETIRPWLSGGGAAIPLFQVFMPRAVLGAVRDVLFSGYIGEGPRVAEFERRLGARLGNRRVLALNTGTSALHLALRLAGVGPGDEVVSTPMTCVATNMPILERGARIVWADIDPWTGNIDPAAVARRLTRRTRAIVAVHWGGYPCELDALNKLAAERGIALIEDACHAFGAVYQGRPIGGHSDFVGFSFQAIKEMTTVDGGALCCRTARAWERGRRLRWYGIDRAGFRKDLRCECDIREYGYKFHMNDVAAAIGLAQLEHVDANIARHRRNARRYDAAFDGLRGVRPLRYASDRSSSYWLYTLRVKRRAEFARRMRAAGITVSPVHVRNDRHTAFRAFARPLPGVDEFDAEHICIPVGWWLGRDQLEHIVRTVREYGAAPAGRGTSRRRTR